MDKQLQSIASFAGLLLPLRTRMELQFAEDVRITKKRSNARYVVWSLKSGKESLEIFSFAGIVEKIGVDTILQGLEQSTTLAFVRMLPNTKDKLIKSTVKYNLLYSNL